MPSLSGRVIQSTSYYLELAEDGAATPPAGEKKQAGPDGEANKANRVPIEVGLKNEAFYEVLAGVSSGTSVLVKPVSRSNFGM